MPTFCGFSKISELKNEVDNLKKEIISLKEDFNKKFDEHSKEFEDFKENYLMRNDQKYLFKKIKSYILKNYDKILLKYTKDESSYVTETWEYKDDNITIVKNKLKHHLFNISSTLTLDFKPKDIINVFDDYFVEYKGITLEQPNEAEEVFDKLQEYKKSA